MIEGAASRFWAKVDKTPGHGPHGDCWVFTGSRLPKGYGRIGWGPNCYNTSAAHVSLELDGRPRPSLDLMALHSCDYPPCVRPEHLSWGTNAENIAQAVERGRMRGRPGETNHLAKLTDDRVREIHASGETLEVLASRFGVSISAISMVRTGKTWRHVK